MPILAAPSVAEGLTSALRRVIELTGATAGPLALRPRGQKPLVVTAGARRAPAALREWLTTLSATPAARSELTRVAPPGTATPAALLRTPLGAANRRVGELVLLGRVGKLTASALPPDLPQEIGVALEALGEREQKAHRANALAELTRVLTVRHTLEEVYAAFAESAAKLVRFDSLTVSLLDA